MWVNKKRPSPNPIALCKKALRFVPSDPAGQKPTDITATDIAESLSINLPVMTITRE